MALQKQLVHLNMTGGLQKKDDQFIVIPSKLTTATDVEFDDASTLVRRGGQAKVDLTPIGAYSAFPPGQAYRAFSHKGAALIENVGSISGVSKVWKTGGTYPVLNETSVSGHSAPSAFYRAGMTTKRVGSVVDKSTASGVGIPFYTGSHDCAAVGDYTCHVWESRDPVSGRVTVRYNVTDESSGFVLLDDTVEDSTYAAPVNVKPRVVGSSTTNKFYIYYATLNSGTVNFSIRCFTVSTAGVVSSAGTLTAGVTAGTAEGSDTDAILFDVAFSTDLTRLGVVTLIDPAVLYFQDVSTSNGSTALDANTVVPTARPRSLTTLYSKNGSSQYIIHAFYGINTNVAKACNFNVTTVATTAETTVGTAAGGTRVGRIAAFETLSDIGIAFDSFSVVGAGGLVSTLRLSSFSHAYSGISECACCTPWFVAGRVASQRSRLYLPMALFSYNSQTTTFLVDLTSYFANLAVAGATGVSPHVVARIDYGEGALVSRWQYTSRVPGAPVRSNSILIPYLKFETDLRIVGLVNDTPWCVSQATVDFSSQLQHEEINGLTFLAGACPHIYDGTSYTEEGFHHGPELVGNPTPIAGGVYSFDPSVTATYTLCFTYGWQDAQGNWHESAPSNEVSVTITTGSGFYTISPYVIVPPTQKSGVRLLMYRTKGSSTDTSLYLATTSYGTSIVLDADLDDGEQLYTAGNVLPNTPAPACRHVSLFQKRLVLSGCGDGSKVHWSKTSSPGYGVEFSSGDPTHQTQVPSDKGRVVATEEMDDRLVVLCENGVGIISGTGPAPTGTQGEYSDYSSIITEVGCSWDSPKSVIRGPEGVWFRSPFGIRLVSRSGSLARTQDGKQVGSEVDPLVYGSVVAIAGDAKQQVRFFAGYERCFVWDYQWLQWTMFSGMASVDAVYADDRYYCLSNYSTTNPLLRYTSDSVYVDVNSSGSANTQFYGYIELPWLAMGGIQGFQRVYRLMILGKNVDSSVQPQDIGLTLNYDYQAAFTFAGPVSVTPTSGGVIQYQHHFVQQKCEAIKIAVYFRPTTAGHAGRFRLTDLTLQVGVKAGLFKVPSSQRF